jgi:hypothetical protein
LTGNFAANNWVPTIGIVRRPLGRQEHDLRAPNMLPRSVADFAEDLKPIQIGGLDRIEMPVRAPQTRTSRARRDSQF